MVVEFSWILSEFTVSLKNVLLQNNSRGWIKMEIDHILKVIRYVMRANCSSDFKVWNCLFCAGPIIPKNGVAKSCRCSGRLCREWFFAVVNVKATRMKNKTEFDWILKMEMLLCGRHFNDRHTLWNLFFRKIKKQYQYVVRSGSSGRQTITSKCSRF